MESRKERRSPRRGYLSPNRNRRSRTRSRSTGQHHRFSPGRGGRSRHSPKRRNRSRSPIGSYTKFRSSKENDVYNIRSRSKERRNRKYDDEIKKPLYRGPEDDASLKRAVTSPSRIIVVRRIGENKSHFNDEKLVAQKLNIVSDRNRTIAEVGEDRKDYNKDGRFVYKKTLRKDQNGSSNQPNYNERGTYEHPSSPNERNSPSARINYEYTVRRDYELEYHGKNNESNRKYRNDDYDRSERPKKHDKKYRSFRFDKQYSDEEKRSHSSYRREGSKDHRQYDKYDKYEDKHRRNKDTRRNDSDHHYQSRDEQHDDHHQNEKLLENQQNPFENDQNDQSSSTNESIAHLNVGLVTSGAIRPIHDLRGIPRPPIVPLTPIGCVRPIYPIRFPFPRLPLPFGMPVIRRVFGPPFPLRFFPHP